MIKPRLTRSQSPLFSSISLSKKTPYLLFGGSFGLAYGLLEKFAPLITSNVQINDQMSILLIVFPSSFLHMATSLVHSYNVFSYLVSGRAKRNLIRSVILFLLAMLLHVIYNCAWHL